MVDRDFYQLYKQVYKDKNLFQVNRKLPTNPLSQRRPNSVIVAGGALGDEGKGRVTDELSHYFLNKLGKVFHYRDNGGANAGHTVVVKSKKIVLHQLASGIIQSGCSVILSRGMVLHPEDLVAEINQVKKAFAGQLPAKLIIDEMAVLSLDTHRAFETAIKKQTTQVDSTSRGISPAYADIIYRHPLRMRDLVGKNFKAKFHHHYRFYRDLIRGLGQNLAQIEVVRLQGGKLTVGNEDLFIARLTKARQQLLDFIKPTHNLIDKAWQSQAGFVIEKAQALGLDKNWGTYPDVTASDCSYEGVHTSSYGIIDPLDISVKTAVIKATYTSSVGKRRMPTRMAAKLENKIRRDANEYGATTGRPRDILYIDLPMLSYLFKVGRVEFLTMTHLDISYKDQPIRVCLTYKLNGRRVGYRPDLAFLARVEPEYIDLPSWQGEELEGIKKISDLPMSTLQYIAFISQALSCRMLMATTGSERSQSLSWLPI